MSRSTSVPYVNRAAFIDFAVDVQGVEEVTREFTRAGSAMRERVKRVLQEVADEIAARARAGAPVASGLLQRKIGATKVAERPDGNELGVVVRPFGGRPSSGGKRYGNFAIGMFAEGGLQPKLIPVRGFTRKTGEGFGFMAGRQLKRSTKIKWTQTSSRVQFVKAYSRQRKAIAAHPFMQPAFRSVRDSITSRIDAAIKGALQGLAA